MDCKESICRNCFHSYVCEQFNENKDDNNEKCHFANDHYIPRADVVPKSEVEELKRYILLNEDISIKCKRENGEQNEEYWKGKIAAFRQIRAYIDAELKKKYTEDQA